jgi:capsular polysaccharide export protein
MPAVHPDDFDRNINAMDSAITSRADAGQAAAPATRAVMAAPAVPFLRVPPFPGARAATLAGPASDTRFPDPELDWLIGRVREARVGGTYWGAQPPLSDEAYTLVRVGDPGERARHAEAAAGPILIWSEEAFDPWHMVGRASRVVADAGDEVALVAAIQGVPTTIIGGEAADLRERLRTIAGATYANPFTGEAMDFAAAMDLCSYWRALIDSNRGIAGAVGFAFWKRATVTPLLWGGGAALAFGSSAPAGARGAIAVWKSRTEAQTLRNLEESGGDLIEVEDGFIRSVGLGAECVPPLSIVVDRSGIYFDPRRPSDLEQLLQNGEFEPEPVERARALRELIVELGVSKYAVGDEPQQRRSGGKRQLLVVGQVDDDRAVREGLGPQSSLELLRRVREDNAGAHIIYKPHPDVEAGHRAGSIPDEVVLSIADEIVRDAPMSSLFPIVDEVHVNTSLAGFEALLRGKAVTTHGVPFYAGWGLTRDLGPVPARRTARRTLDELVAAALLLYPRYLDPVTGLPCPPEILIRRLANGAATSDGVLVRLRRLQGFVNRGIAALGGRAR